MDFELAYLRAQKLLFGLSSPLARKALKLGVAAAIDHRAALSRLAPDLVLDVGANRGQFALIARYLWPTARIVSFEPLPGAAELARKVMAGDDRARLVVAAIGADRSTMKINVTSADDSSSLLPLGDKHKALYHSSVATQIDVPVGPLSDHLTANELGGSTLLKIDTQGFELEVLKGAVDILPKIDHVYAELSFVELYVGQPLASEVIVFLDRAGFELVGVHNVTCDASGQPIQADMLFKRRAGAESGQGAS